MQTMITTAHGNTTRAPTAVRFGLNNVNFIVAVPT